MNTRNLSGPEGRLVPKSRIRVVRDEGLREDGAYVLLWMTAQRRTRYQFALQRAVNLANELQRPLYVLEGLRVGYRWASVRHHRFVIEGMVDNRDAFAKAGVRYHPYVEPAAGDGSGLLAELAKHACAVVTDTYPCFFLRGLADRVRKHVPVRFEEVDSCGFVPLSTTERVFTTAYSFRRFLQTALCEHLGHLPETEPLKRLGSREVVAVPSVVSKRWPATDLDLCLSGGLSQLPIDQTVGPAVMKGGQREARKLLSRFVKDGLVRYGERNHPDEEVASYLSPHLHFGHISSVEIFEAMARAEEWTPGVLTPQKHGKRTGWWGMSPGAEGFVDQLITWRELGLNMCFHRDDYDQLHSLPQWAQTTMLEHAEDPRPQVYTLEQLDASETEDPIWNAAQKQLVVEGRMHNYLRMLWGKKIYQWSPTPADALANLIELNNRYAVDGRDPNSYSGIFWVLGRYDRAWGPERPIFGKLRYMTSDSTKRKLKMKQYLARFASAQATLKL